MITIYFVFFRWLSIPHAASGMANIDSKILCGIQSIPLGYQSSKLNESVAESEANVIILMKMAQ